MQRVILIGVNLSDKNFEKSMEELHGLAEACDYEVAGEITQNLDKVNAATYLGSGKVPEAAAFAAASDAQLAIFNDELSPSQIRNLEEKLGCGIMDRTALILEIFARRAKTREAKLQVETANLQYKLPRLVGLRKSLEQQVGGVGTTNRGAGEKQLELNRRQIQTRISRLRAELNELADRRKTQRRQREKAGIPVVSLVGYTNAGKSTVMNALLSLTGSPQDKNVFEKDMLFATLETSVRKIELSDKKTFLLTDTVGFIDRLPHNLVRAFRSTLEEAADADLIIHVVDCSNSDYERQIEVTEKTLGEIGASGIPVIYAYNKADKLDIRPQAVRGDNAFISAKYKTGLDDLIALIRKQLFENYVRAKLLLPYKNSADVSYLREHATIFSAEYTPQGTKLSLELTQKDYNRFQPYLFPGGAPGGGQDAD